MDELLADLLFEFRRHKLLVDRAIAPLDDRQFFQRPTEEVNSVALIVKHLAGNLASRWTDFLSSDGEKSGRDREAEFILSQQDTRAGLLTAWEQGWQTLFDSVGGLSPSDFGRTVTIREEKHTVLQALLRGVTHAAYHTGQILYLARLLRPEGAWLTVAPGQSRNAPGAYRKAP